MEALRISPETIEPTSENLTAILTCIGASASPEIQQAVLERQNPYGQKRSGLGFGGYAAVTLPGSGSSFVNINLYNRVTARSPLAVRMDDSASGNFDLLYNGLPFTKGTFLSLPAWGSQTLSSGKPAITVLQQHGPRNLVGVLGDTRCPLFDQNAACEFCMMDGGEGNVQRSVEEIAEAFALAQAQGRSSYNLTLTTTLFDGVKFAEYVKAVLSLKQRFATSPFALEVQPLIEDEMRALKDAGLDTLMVPLDCASEAAQDRFVRGKKALLQERYWRTMPEAVRLFGAGNVTSSIIVGLEDERYIKEAIRQMIAIGIIPEPIPVRWDESKLSGESERPLTNPLTLVEIRRFLTEEIVSSGLAKAMTETRAGCAACGGCAGIVPTKLPTKGRLSLL